MKSFCSKICASFIVPIIMLLFIFLCYFVSPTYSQGINIFMILTVTFGFSFSMFFYITRKLATIFMFGYVGKLLLGIAKVIMTNDLLFPITVNTIILSIGFCSIYFLINPIFNEGNVKIMTQNQAKTKTS